MAELSPYFADQIYVRKNAAKRYVIEQATPNEVLEFLRCITFCPMRKPLSGTRKWRSYLQIVFFPSEKRFLGADIREQIRNETSSGEMRTLHRLECHFAEPWQNQTFPGTKLSKSISEILTVMYCVDHVSFLTSCSVKGHHTTFLKFYFSVLSSSFHLFQVTCAMSQCDPNSSTMSVLVDKLAGIKVTILVQFPPIFPFFQEEDLSRLQFADMPGDVVAEVFAQKIQRTKDKKGQRHLGDSDDEAPAGCCFT